MGIKTKLKRVISVLLHGEPKQVIANVVTLAPSELLKQRCALITGGTSGIGYSIAEAYLKAGIKAVVITGRSQEKIDVACQRLSKYGLCLGFVMDNTQVDKFSGIFKRILQELAQYEIHNVDILVNNAGVLGASIPNAKEEDYDKILDTNLKGVFFLTQFFCNYMVKNNIKGNVLNIASSSSLRPAISAYTISKWGLRGLTLGFARAYAKYGITINGLAPGPTATPMLIHNDDKNLLNTLIPLGRFALPEEIANMAVFLVSDMGHAIIGDIIYMTGGAGLVSYEDINYNLDIELNSNKNSDLDI